MPWYRRSEVIYIASQLKNKEQEKEGGRNRRERQCGRLKTIFCFCFVMYCIERSIDLIKKCKGLSVKG